MRLRWKSLVFFISYLIYFCYGFFASCLYAGLGVIAYAIENSKSIILPIIGIVFLFFLFLSTCFWVFAKSYSGRTIYFYSSSRILLIFTPFLVSLLWVIERQENYLVNLISVYFGIFVVTLPLWVCIALWPSCIIQRRYNTKR